MKKRYSITILIIILVLITIASQSFTIFNLGNSDAINFNTDYLGSSAKENIYVIDNYTLIVTAKENEYSSIGCDTTDNWNYKCDERIDYVDNDGCSIISSGKIMYSCPSGYVHNILKTRTFPAYKYSRNCCYNSGRWADASRYCDNSARRVTTGMKYDDNVIGHFFKTDLYYKGGLIDSSEGEFTDGFTGETLTYHLTHNGFLGNQNNSFYRLYIGSKETDGSDRRIGGQFRLTAQESDFTWNIIPPKDIVYTGDDIELKIKLDSKIANFDGNLIIDYTVVTGLVNATKQDSSEVTINKGSNEFIINIPNNNPINKLIIQPSLELYYDASNWTNGKIIYAGTIIGDEQTISIRSSIEKDLNIKLLSQEDQLEELRLLQSENAELISSMNLNLDDQINEIINLRQSTEENILLVSELESEVSNQLFLIDGLKTSQSNKEEMIAKLLVLIDDEESKVFGLLQELNASDEEITNILILYEDELIKQSDSTSQLSLSNEEANRIISDLNNNLISEKEATERLKVSNMELTNLVNEYEDRLKKLQTVVDSFEGKRGFLFWLMIFGMGVLVIGLFYFAVTLIPKAPSKRRGRNR